ncbi:MAG: hypothetical protein ACI9U2_000894, partial [Bradymonadia bacterium]
MTAVEHVRDRHLRAGALRVGAVLLGGVAVLLGLGAGLWSLAPLALLAAVRRPSATDAADRLDAQLDQDGGVRTAWDHRADASPMAIAQRRRLTARLTDDAVQAASP